VGSNRIIFYLSHRYDFVFYLRLQEALRANSMHQRIEILLSPSLAENRQLVDAIVDNFDGYEILPIDLNYSIFFWQSVIRSIFLKRWLTKRYAQNEIVISFDKSNFISNFILTHFRRAILLQNIETHSSGFRTDLRTCITRNFFHLLCGCRLMIFLKHKSSKGHIMGLVFQKHDKPNICYQTKAKNISPKFSLPPLVNCSSGKKIVIFGSRFNDWKFLRGHDLVVFKKTLSTIYKRIGDFFKEYEFVYIPHPLEAGSEYCDVNSWMGGIANRITGYVSSEHYLFCNRDVVCCFSIGSTSSHSAYNMGFNTKIFYKSLSFNPEIESVFDDIFHGLPVECFNNNLGLINGLKNTEYGDMRDFIKMLSAHC
jgi:hypothetical protein